MAEYFVFESNPDPTPSMSLQLESPLSPLSPLSPVTKSKWFAQYWSLFRLAYILIRQCFRAPMSMQSQSGSFRRPREVTKLLGSVFIFFVGSEGIIITALAHGISSCHSLTIIFETCTELLGKKSCIRSFFERKGLDATK